MREHVSGGIGLFGRVARRMTVAVVTAGLVAIASSGFAAASQLRLVTFNVAANVTAGSYNVYAWWSQGANRSATAPYKLPGEVTVNVNQQTNGGKWNLLGSGLYSGATEIRLSCWTGTGFVVIADAIKLGP